MAEQLRQEPLTDPASERSPVEERSHSESAVMHEGCRKWELWLSSLSHTNNTKLCFKAHPYVLKSFFFHLKLLVIVLNDKIKCSILLDAIKSGKGFNTERFHPYFDPTVYTYHKNKNAFFVFLI